MPVLSYFFLKRDVEEEPFLLRLLMRYYHRVLNSALKHSKSVLVGVLSMFIFCLFLLSRIGTEFAPTSTIGRSEKGEPEDVYYIETFVTLKPYKEWKTLKSRHELENALREKLKDIPGVHFSFTQPIQMRIDELLSGVKSTVAVKVFGDDLNKINEIAYRVEDLIKDTKGAVDVETEAQSGKLQLKIIPKTEILSRYDLTVKDILSVIRGYFASEEVSYIKQGVITFPIVVRLREDILGSVDKISQLTFKTEEGYVLTLSQVAEIKVSEGFAKIRHENGQRFALVQSNLEGRDLGGFVKEIKEKIEKNIKLPEGYYIKFGGQFENQERAMKRLSVIVPVVILH